MQVMVHVFFCLDFMAHCFNFCSCSLQDSTASDIDGREMLVSFILLIPLSNHLQVLYCRLWTEFLPL